jgi:hypothetical protein
MGILAYKSKSGDTYAVFGEGEITISEGIFRTESDGKSSIYCVLEKQEIVGKDSSVKDDKGKASTVELPFPIKAKIMLDGETYLGKALTAIFTRIKPELANGFKGEINYSVTRSATRIALDDMSKAEFDLAGGLCDLVPTEVTATFDTSGGGGYQKGGTKSYKSVTEIADERAAVLISMITDFDKPIGLAYLKITEFHETIGVPVPTPLQVAHFLCGGSK